MSSFYNIGVPEYLLSPSHIVLITQINKKAMDSGVSGPDLLIKPVIDNHLLPDDMIKPMILTFEKKITLNQGLISTPADDEGPISCNINPTAGDNKQVISNSASSAEGEEALWPKLIDDRPSSAYLFPKQSELNDRPPSPSHEKPPNTQMIRDPAHPLPKLTVLNLDRPPSPTIRATPAYQTELGNRPSSPSSKNVIMPHLQVIRESAYQSPHEAELDACKSLSADDEGSGKPKTLAIREVAYHDKLSEMKESYRSSPARARLSRVVEESESFSRKEFGADVLNYMSTHSSANHATNISTFSYKHPSYHHSTHSNFSYNHSSYQSGNFTSKSAPAGTAVRTGSAFGLFRRGSSEGSNLGAGGRVYRRPKSRKPRSLAHKLLWPLLKIRNGYVGCMMGLDGAGDLSGMAQGGTYATRARYFADVPLSKTDSRNHG